MKPIITRAWLLCCLLPTHSPAALKTWDGGAGTPDWADAANWAGDGTPSSSTAVLLDNSTVNPLPTLNTQSNANAASLTLNGTAPATFLNYGGATPLVLNLHGASVDPANTGPLIQIAAAAPVTATVNKVDFRLRTSGRIHIDTGKQLTLSNCLVSESGGSFSVTKTGAGALNFTGSGPKFLHTGGLIIEEGSITPSATTFCLPTSGPVTFANAPGVPATIQSTNSHSIVSLEGGNPKSLLIVTGSTGLTITGNSHTSFGGVIDNNGASLTKLVHAGTGSLTLTGGNPFTGATTISAGRLALGADGMIGSTAISIAAGASFDVSAKAGNFSLETGVTLSGNGSVLGPLGAGSGSTISPGSAPGMVGTLTVSNGLNLGADSSLAIDLTPSGNDQLVVTSGNLVLAGNLGPTTLTGTVTTGDVIYLMLNNGPGTTTGTLAGAADGGKIEIGGQRFRLSITSDFGGVGFVIGGSGNDVALMAIEDPSPSAISFQQVGSLLDPTIQTVFTWQDNAANETGYRILRSDNGAAFVEIGTAAANATGFTDTTSSPATAYRYIIQALDASGDLGDPTTIVVPAAAPTLAERRQIILDAGVTRVSSRGDLKSELHYHIACLLTKPPGSAIYNSSRTRILQLLVANDPATNSLATDPFRTHAAMNGFLAAREHYTPEMIAETKRVVQLPDYSLTSAYVSENFYFMYNGSGFLACEQWPDFTDAGGKTGASLKAGFRSQLITAFNRIVTGNLYEHGSPVYYVTSIVPIRMIAEFAQDPEVKRKAWATLDALMLHLACDWNQGYYATAAARCKGWSNITGSPQAMNASQTTGWLFYGGYRPITISTSDFAHSIWMAFPRQYETPPAFQQVATRRSMSFQHRSSTWGGTNSDFKNVWHTPEYTLSSMYEIFSSSQNGKEQQPVCFKWLSDKQESTIIIGSENHIQFYNSGRTNSLSFFPYDPARNSMGYGTNPYMQHFQHRQTLVGVGNVSPWYANSHPDLTAEEAAATPEIDPLYFAELYLPLTQKGAILKTLEDSASGWLFCHAGSTLFAFWTHSPYYWGADIAGARMLRSKALKNAWILETAATSDYPSAVGVDAQLDAFKADVLSNGAINSSNVATTLPRLHYTSIHGYALDLTWRPHQTDNFWVRGRFTEPKGWPADAWKYTNQAKVDGIAVEYDGTSWPLLGNPWVTQQGGANNLAIDIDDIRTTYKFTTNASTWGRPPSLDKVAPLIIGRGNSIAIPLQVADEETGAGSVSLAVTAENEALLPASSLVFSGSGAERTLTISAPPGLTGITSLQLTATDPDGATWSQTIPVTIGSGPLVSIVNPGPDPFPLPAGVLIGNLSAAITDPGSAPVTSTLWSLFSGPAAVTFGNASALETSVTFTSPGTYVLQFAATSSEATGLGHVTLVVGQPVYGGDLIFGATPGDPAVETVNVTENTIYDRLLVQTASSAPNILNIGAGITATIDGNAVLNPGASGTSATKLNVIGATGTLAITNTASGSILLGSNFSGAVNTSTLDMSQLGTFTASLGSSGSGVFNIGIGTTSTASTPTTVILANTSTVTAPSIRVGAPSGGGNAGTVALKLGSGTNMLNTDTFHIGTYFNGGRSGGSVTFNSATGSLILRSANGSGRADVNLVNNQGGSTGTAVTGTMDLGGSPDASTHLLIDDLNLAARTGGGSCTATMTHRAGVLDVNTLRMSQIANSISTSSLGVTSTLNLNGGTVAFNSLVSIGSNNLASTSSGTGATGTATLNIAGAAVTSIAPSFILGNRSGSAGGNVVAALNLSAGSLTLGSDIIRIDNAVGIGTTTKSTLTLNGGTLNMAGYDIGDSIHPISFIAQSGTLNHPGTINGTGGLTKTTAGTLILHAATYTGNTTVADGTLQLTGTNLPDSSALVIGTGTGSPAMLHLPDAGSDTVATLIIDGVTMPAGLYGSTNSGGAITGSGTIEVTAFSTWIQSFPGISGAAGNPLADSDSDGLNNIAEFALDGNPVSGASTGKVVGRTVTVGGNPALVLTIPVRQGAVFSGTTDLVSNPIDGVIYKIEGSGQLNEWDLTISEVAGPDATAIHAGMPALSAGWSYRTFQSPAAPSMQRKFLRAAILTP